MARQSTDQLCGRDRSVLPNNGQPVFTGLCQSALLLGRILPLRIRERTRNDARRFTTDAVDRNDRCARVCLLDLTFFITSTEITLRIHSHKKLRSLICLRNWKISIKISFIFTVCANKLILGLKCAHLSLSLYYIWTVIDRDFSHTNTCFYNEYTQPFVSWRKLGFPGEKVSRLTEPSGRRIPREEVDRTRTKRMRTRVWARRVAS